MTDLVLKLLLLITPIAYTTGMNLTLFDMAFFRLGAIILFCASLFDKPKREVNLALPISLTLGLCIFNLFTHAFNSIVFSYTLNIFLALLSLFIIVTYASPLKEFKKWIMGATIINLLALIIQQLGFNPFFDNNPEQGGLMGNAPRLVDYLTIISPILFSISWVFIVLLAIISLVLKEFVLLGFIAVWLFLKITDPRFRIGLVLVSLLGIGLLHKQLIHSLVYVRWEVWKPAIENIFNHPLNGYGLGAFSTLSQKIGIYQTDYAMNSYLEFIWGAGLSGLILIGLGIKKFIKHFNINAETLSVLAFLILALVEYPFEIPKLWFTIIAIIGFYIIKTKEEVC